jgi:outer membrane protein assembly factor BamB
MFLRIFLLFVAVFISGCGSLIGKKEEIVDPPAVLVDFQPSLAVTRLWERNTGSGTNKHYLKLAPVIADGKVIIADTNKKVIAINPDNGRNIWTYQLVSSGQGFWSKGENLYITGGPGYGQNTVLVGTNKGDVIALDAETGKELWNIKVSSEVLAAPQIADDVVIVRSLDGKIHALDARNGRRIWLHEKSVPALTLRGNSAPVIDDGIVISGFDSGRLSALDIASSRLIWDISIATPSGRSELERLVDINADPVIVDGIVYVATFQGQLAALTLTTGRMLWNRELSSHAGFSVDESNVYITDDKSIVWAIDRFNGSPVWKQEGLSNREVTAPTSVGNHIVAGDFEGYIHWMNKITGAFSAREKISGKRILAAPVASGNVVYTYATDGRLAAYTY